MDYLQYEITEYNVKKNERNVLNLIINGLPSIFG